MGCLSCSLVFLLAKQAVFPFLSTVLQNGVRPSVDWYVRQTVFAFRVQLTFLPNNDTCNDQEHVKSWWI